MGEITEIGSHNKIGTTGTRKRARAESAGTESHIRVGTTGTSEEAGPDPDIQKARSPTVQVAHAQQNERITQPQKENLMPGPDLGTQGPTPPQRGGPIPRPGPHIQRPAPPLSRVPPAHQNERVTQPQRENPVPRPESGTQRVTP